MKKLMNPHNTDVLIISIIVIVLAGIAIPNFLRARSNYMQFERYYETQLKQAK